MDATTTAIYAGFQAGFSQATSAVTAGAVTIMTLFLAIAGVIFVYKWAKGSLAGKRK